MSDRNHPIKSSSGTAGLVAAIVSLVPENVKDHQAFLYVISIIPPFLVWVQNWLWKNGASILKDLSNWKKTWSMEKDLRKAMNDPLVNRDHKAKLKKAYSESKTDGLLSKIDEIKNS